MKIKSIKEAGVNNTIKWAMKNGAVLIEDIPLMSVINDEYFYLVTFEDVNFFEVFRLTQFYRDKIRIVNESTASIPSDGTLEYHFPGQMNPPTLRNLNFDPQHKADADNPEWIPNPDYDKESPSPIFKKMAHETISRSMAMCQQMLSDSDIIGTSTTQLFLPMITRKFDVTIPISFIDVARSITNEEDYATFFSNEYPDNLPDIINELKHPVMQFIALMFMKLTTIIEYNDRYDQYVKVIKHAPLYKIKTPNLYKSSLVGFHKRDNVTKTDIKIGLFQPQEDDMNKRLRHLGRLSTPLVLEFAIQLPIQYMQMLCAEYDPGTIGIMYESSMSAIQSNKLEFNSFNTFELQNPDDEAEKEAYDSKMNEIAAYRVRITETEDAMLTTMLTLLANKDKQMIDINNVFALLPSIYRTNAIISFQYDDIKKLTSHPEPIIAEMFADIAKSANAVMTKINQNK